MAKNELFPKVMIIGESFHLKSGGGITLINLFRDWPPDRIAVASSFIDASGQKYCNSFYKLGFEETKRPWPFYLIQPKTEFGPVDFSKKTSAPYSPGRVVRKKNPVLKRFLLQLRHYLGIYPFIYRLRISEKLGKWIDEFQPEIIYTQLSSIQMVQFTIQLYENKKIPLAIHIMDDWPATLREPGLLFFYWKSVLNRDFRRLLDYPGVHMSIGNAMSEAYLVRYKKEFIPFQNSLDLNKWESVAKSDWQVHNVFTVMYAGRIGRGVISSVMDIAEAIEILGNQGYRILFKIRAGGFDLDNIERINSLRFTELHDFLWHDEMPGELSSADLLVIPLDFNEIKFTRLSMPTKVPEYLASGTPVLVYASGETALCRYAGKHQWGYIVTKNKISELVKAISLLYSDTKLRKKLGVTGRSVAREYHDGDNIRRYFRETLLKAIQ
jgi:glycosyltransferase involved in cell wall biosynthesis